MKLVLFCAVVAFSAHFVAGETDVKPEEHNIAKRAVYTCDRTYKCPEYYYCRYPYCTPNYRCSYHGHCPYGFYCVYREGACKKGERYCRDHHECPPSTICLRGKCAKKECRSDRECEGDNKECDWPGICKVHQRRCNQGYDCKSGDWICLQGWCKKKQCRYDGECKPSEKCEYPGVCKPRPNYCNATTALCGAGQCCVRPGNYPHGKCEAMRQEGHWCSTGTCPCVAGTVCKKKDESEHWGKCTAEESGSGSGGSGDF